MNVSENHKEDSNIVLSCDRLTKKNPFCYAIEGIVSEWLQLLLVVERIKQDKIALKTLNELARFTIAFFDHDELKERVSKCGRRPSFLIDVNYQKRSQWNFLELFFETLDEDKEYRLYLSKAVVANESEKKNDTEKNLSCNLLLDVIPNVCDELSFSWSNLNKIRMNYPHMLIVKAFLYGDEIISNIESLIDFYKSKNTEMVQKIVRDFVSDVRSGNLSYYDKDIDFSSAIKYHKDMIRNINEKLEFSFLSETVKLINQINDSAAINSYNYNSIVNNTYLFDRNIDGKEDEKGEGLEIFISNKMIGYAFNYEEENELINLLMDEIFKHAKEKKIINNSILEKIENNNNYCSPTHNPRLSDALYHYNWWIREQNYFILSGSNNLNLNVILRGIKFSIWYEKYTKYNKKNILNGSKEYVDSLGIKDSYLTVKQSYEFIKRFSKKELKYLINEQVNERLYSFDILSKLFFPPFNYTIYLASLRFYDGLKSIFGCYFDARDFDRLVTLYKNIEKILSETKESEFNFEELSSKIFGHVCESNSGCFTYNKNDIKRSKLELLLLYRLDIINE